MTKDITIVAIDTYAHDLTRCAIEQTLSVIPCKEVLVLSDRNIFPDGRWVEINPIDIREYNAMMVKHLWPFIKTEHVLIVQYDGMAVDQSAWSDSFLDFDYIGAIWPWAHHPPEFKVGNGGFSLRSRKLLNACKNNDVVLTDKLPMYEDLYVCVHYKSYLESKGIRYADIDTAQKFSHEHDPGFKPTFGFHGTFNVPYYLNDQKIYQFLELLPGYSSEGTLLMVAHLFQTNKIDLGRAALDFGRSRTDDFDSKLKQVIHNYKWQLTSNEFQQIFQYLK